MFRVLDINRTPVCDNDEKLCAVNWFRCGQNLCRAIMNYLNNGCFFWRLAQLMDLMPRECLQNACLLTLFFVSFEEKDKLQMNPFALTVKYWELTSLSKNNRGTDFFWVKEQDWCVLAVNERASLTRDLLCHLFFLSLMTDRYLLAKLRLQSLTDNWSINGSLIQCPRVLVDVLVNRRRVEFQ